MKKKIIIAISIIILLVFIYVLTAYSLVGIAKLDAAGRLRIPLRVRTTIWGWQSTYGQGRALLFSTIIIFLFYLLLFSVIIYLIIRLVRKIKERNRI